MKKLQIKRILALVAAVCMLLVTVTSALPVAAADPTVVYEFHATTDWTGQKNGTVTIGTCSKGPAYTYIKFSKFGTIYIGDYDLTKAGSVVFDVTGAGKNWETDYPDAHTIQFCADFEGQRVVGESKMVATKGYGEEMFTQTVYLADGYNGPLYIRLNCGTGHEYCIANLKFYERTGDEPEVTLPDEPTTEPDADPEEGVVYQFTPKEGYAGEKSSNVTIGRTSKGPAYTYVKLSKYGYIYIGDYDLSKVQTLTMDVTGALKSWIEDYPDGYTVRLCKNAEGTEVLAESNMVATIGYGNAVYPQYMAIDTDYSGPVYMFLNCSTGHEYCVTNLKFYEADVIPAISEKPMDENTLYSLNITEEWVAALPENAYTGVKFGVGSAGAGYNWIKFNHKYNGENFVYLGDFDLSGVGTIAFDAATSAESKFTKFARLVFSKDAAGTEILTSVAAQSGLGWVNPAESKAYLNTDYNGPVYVSFMDSGCTDGYFAGNFRFLKKTGNEPLEESEIPTYTPPTHEYGPDEVTPTHSVYATPDWINGLQDGQMAGVTHGFAGQLGDDYYLYYFEQGENYLYVGDFDLSALDFLTIDFVSEQAELPAGTVLRLVTSPDCQTVLAETSALTGEGLAKLSVVTVPLDCEYNGPVYLMLAGEGMQGVFGVSCIRFYTTEGGEEITFPEEDLDTTAEPETNEGTEPDTNGESDTGLLPSDTTAEPSETNPEKKGCGSVVTVLMLPLMATLAWALRRKEY